ncbi:hypothetical protein UlMin_031907 [Ulmus minor]
MSRCFPFPPPGYEKKATLGDTDLLTKEKHKEKRHKKDKKDKDKKEHKEKKDKDRGIEKNGKRKDRKEKHKDKKEKDRGRNETPKDKKEEGKLELNYGEKLGPDARYNFEVNDFKYVQDLDHRIKKDDGAARSQVDQKTTEYVQELDRRIKKDDGAARSQVVQKTTVTDKNGAELPNHFKERDRSKDKKEHDWKFNLQRNHVEERHSANSIAHKVVEKRMEGRDENKHKDARSDHNPINKVEEKKIKSKDTDRGKEKEKKKKAKEITNPSIGQPHVMKNGKKSTDTCDEEQLVLSQVNVEKLPSRSILGKRKEHDINGDLHGNGFLPHKSLKPSLSHPVMENGSKLEPCETEANKFKAEKPPSKSILGKHKEHEINGNGYLPHKLVKPSLSHPVMEIGSKLEPCQTEANKVNVEKPPRKSILDIHKEHERNGGSHGNGFLPHNLLKPLLSHPVMENGGKLEPCQTEAINGKVGIKEHEINGLRSPELPNGHSTKPLSSTLRVKENGGTLMKTSHQDSTKPLASTVRVKENGGTSMKTPHLDSTKPSSAALQVKENGETSMKTPHPDSTKPSSSTLRVKENGETKMKPHQDSKYLSVILSVPKMAELSDHVDQEWLFNSNRLETEKAFAGIEDTPQVWEKALQLDFADVLALPYVLPY